MQAELNPQRFPGPRRIKVPFVQPRIDWGGRRGGGSVGVGCPVWNKHECSLSSLRHHTSLPTFTAALEKREQRVGGEDLRMGVRRVPGRRRGRVGFAGGGEREAEGRGGACVRPGELIGTALLFYPPTKACSFGKAHCRTARQPLQSRFTAAAERSQHPSFFGLALLSQSDSHTGIRS